MISVRAADGRDIEGCVRVLEQLPDYFTPATHDAVRRSIPSHRAWVASDGEPDDDVVGFLAFLVPYAALAIHAMSAGYYAFDQATFDAPGRAETQAAAWR